MRAAYVLVAFYALVTFGRPQQRSWANEACPPAFTDRVGSFFSFSAALVSVEAELHGAVGTYQRLSAHPQQPDPLGRHRQRRKQLRNLLP